MFLTSSNLSGVSHGFFTRKGGVSKGIYASLNCGLGTEDEMANVIENRERVVSALKAKDARLLSVYQVHGSDVVTVEAPWRNAKKPKADAMVTKQPCIALGILTADCVPVLFADAENKVIGAAHAGWKGLIAGVLERTAEAMQAVGAQHIRAAIGPAIGKTSYEVGAELKEQFIQQEAAYEAYFQPGKDAAHFFFDIRGVAREKLQKAGISDINLLENDTYIEEDAFFSFRRTTHRKEPDYGRQISAIMLK